MTHLCPTYASPNDSPYDSPFQVIMKTLNPRWDAYDSPYDSPFQVIMKTLNPRWDAAFASVLHNECPAFALKVAVWDWDRVGRDDYLGDVTTRINLSENDACEVRVCGLVFWGYFGVIFGRLRCNIL